VAVGLDNGGTANNATVVDAGGRFLVDRLVETPSYVREGPEVAVKALVHAFEHILEVTGTAGSSVRAVGLDTPGPASADGVISSKGSTNFSHHAWPGFDVRRALETALGLPVLYNNDGNAAALYAHHVHFGPEAARRSSVSAIVGTGLGGGVIESGRIVRGVAGMAGELGHVHVPLHGLLDDGQPLPLCNCGFVGDAESIASLTGIQNNLLPYWLTRYPDHELNRVEPFAKAAQLVRAYGERGDAMALRIFEQQAMALGRLFTIAANFSDPDAYFLGGGVVEVKPEFREWFLARVREHTLLRAEQARGATLALVPDLDMAGARGAALAAMASIENG
jgi:glucokinase